MKATFAMSATIDARDTAISNGRLLSDTPGPGAGKHTLTFATTKRMSPYLVALAVGDWECLSDSADGIPIRVCGTPNRKGELGFALESAEFALRYFNRYFAIKYPFEKLDIVAVPDFSAGAMENTGAIFFREQFLARAEGRRPARAAEADGAVSSPTRSRISGSAISSRWQWWDDIWLNEGFATWMERRPMQESKPEWNGALEEVRDTQRAMAARRAAHDAARAHAGRYARRDQPGLRRDRVSENRVVIRMVEGYVGRGTATATASTRT